MEGVVKIMVQIDGRHGIEISLFGWLWLAETLEMSGAFVGSRHSMFRLIAKLDNVGWAV